VTLVFSYTWLSTLPAANGGTQVRTLARSLLLATLCQLGFAQAVDVDTGRSSVTVKVEKSGLFSAFAHNHTIQAPLASGSLDAAKRTATITFNTKEMKVVDEGVKESERADIEQTMKSEKVLDVQKFPEVRFVSTSITPQDGGRFQLRGDLTLHGTTRPVEFPLTFSNAHYAGSVKLKQTDFGITPVTVAGGTVKVKDVIEVVFEIVPK
jgi:polyisoprenoid-binding protein YceI